MADKFVKKGPPSRDPFRRSGNGLLPQVFQDLPRRVPAGQPRDAAAGVRAGAAQIESQDRRAVLGPSEDRAREEELIERVLAVEEVAAREAVGRFEVRWRDDA